MQCLCVSSFMEFFGEFLWQRRTRTVVVSRSWERVSGGGMDGLRGKKAFDLLTPQIPMPPLFRPLPSIRIKWGGKKSD